MNCTQVRKFFPLFVGGDLDPETAGLVRNHLKSCPGCRRVLKDHEGPYLALRTLRDRPDVFPLLEGLSADVLARLGEEPAGKAAPVPRPYLLFFPFTAFSRTAAAAAAVIVLAGAAFFAGLSWQDGGGAAGDTARTALSSPAAAEGGNVLPAGMDAADREGLKPEFIILRPQQLPKVRPVLHRRGF